MKRSTKSKELAMEIMVGSFVFAALLSLSFFTIILSGEALFKAKYRYQIRFNNVMGLREGDNVVTRGMPVGKVKSLNLEGDSVLVVVSLHKPLRLREDYKAEIVLSSVLGGRYLQVHEGNDASFLDADAELVGQCPRDLVTEATALISEVKEIAERIKQGEGTLGKLLVDDSLYTEARDVVAELKSSMREGGLLKNLEESAANINDVTRKLNSGEGTLGKLLVDESLYADAKDVVGGIRSSLTDGELLKNLEESAANIKDITQKINSGQGVIGKLVNDEDLYDEVKHIMRDARATLNDLRETAPIITLTSILFGAF